MCASPPKLIGQRRRLWLAIPLVVLAAVLLVYFYAFAPVAVVEPTGTEGENPSTSESSTAASIEEGMPNGSPSGSRAAAASNESSDEPGEIQVLQREAIEVAEKLMVAFPKSAEATSVMAMVYHRMGNTSEATKWFKRCLKLDPNFAEAYHGMGSMALRKGDNEEAADLLRKAVSLNPASTGPRLQLAEALMGTGELEEAVNVLRENASRTVGTSQLLYSLGDAYDQIGEYSKAKEAYLTALDIDPDLRTAYYRLARVCAKLGQKEEAESYMKEFAERGKAAREAQRKWAQETNDLSACLEVVADIHTAAAQVYRKQGWLRIAEAHWLRAAHLVPTDAVCRRELLMLYGSMGRTAELLSTLQDLEGIEPQNPSYPLQIGAIHARANHFAEAERAFLKVIQIAPQQPDGYLAAVRLYAFSGRKTEEAVRLATKAVELAPSAHTYLFLSAAHKSNGDNKAALVAIDQALERDPNNTEYQRMRDVLLQE